MVLHGVQSHAGWYHGLGRRLACHGYHAHFPDRRGSGSNTEARGHTPSAQRLLDDVLELDAAVKTHEHASRFPHDVVGISWGGKLAVCLAAQHPETFQAVALVCPGLHPRVGVGLREKLGVARAVITGKSASRFFPIPLADPSLFTSNPEGQAFIASDPLSLRFGSGGLMFASRTIDTWVRRAPEKVHSPFLLMLAGNDLIVDNQKTLAFYHSVASSSKQLIDYPEGHHTLEFDPDPATYANHLVRWLNETLQAHALNHA